MSNHVHCRIGSSEKSQPTPDRRGGVHCRIGSSEKARGIKLTDWIVHCRIGSSEMRKHPQARVVRSSLPHRQLRKAHDIGSPPY